MPSTATSTDPIAPIVERMIRDDGGPIIAAGHAGEISQPALDAVQDLVGAARDALEAGRQLDSDLRDLERRRDLLPPDGFGRLVRDAKRVAAEAADEAQHAMDGALRRLEAALVEDALPRVDPAREGIARDEAMMTLSSGDAATTAMQIAQTGSDEALAALLSPWGRAALAARGVHNVDATLRDVHKVARARVVERGDTTAARLLRRHLAGLAAVAGQAGSRVRELAGGSVW